MNEVSLQRRALAEFVGTALLVAAVVGSGIAAQRLSPGHVGLELLENALATGAALVAIIFAFAPTSGAHINPVVTLVSRYLKLIDTPAATAYVVSQFAGGIAGALVANAMFGRALVSFSVHARATGPHLLAEVVATFGLVVVVFVTARSAPIAVPFAVGGYITAAYWFTSSTSFANPAVAVARMFSNTFAGIAPSSVPGFVGMELVGGALAAAYVVAVTPGLGSAGVASGSADRRSAHSHGEPRGER